MMMEAERIRGMAEQLIRENPKERIIDFTLEEQKYWIKRKLGNGRNQLVKYSVEKEAILEETGAALAALHHDHIIHGRPALRDITYRDGRLTFLDWENRLYSRNRETLKAIDFLLLLQGICRENYREEKSRVAAVRRGYEENGGVETVEDARRFLKSHGFIGSLVHFLSPFRMKDIESVRKIYDYMK